MNELLAFSNISKVHNKAQRIKKTVEKREPVTFEKKDVSVHLVEHPKSADYMGYLHNESYGFFYNKEDPTMDYFYRCLQSLKQQHISLLGDMDGIRYITPFTGQGFKFKSARVLRCYDKYGECIDYKKCIRLLCKFTVQIRPYDFMKDEQRIAGLKIKVIAVTLV